MGRTSDGVENRGTSIRISFTLEDGEVCKERLTLNGKSMLPTPANLKYATRLAAEVRRTIELGRFTWAEYFPDSPRAAAPAAEVLTLGKLAKLWLESKGRSASSTKDQYGRAARFWLKLLGADTTLPAITQKVLAAKIGGYPWPSAKTHNNYLIALRGMFDLEFRGPDTVKNPLIGITNMKVVRKLPDPLTIAERDVILADLAKHYDERVVAYFRFAFFTGMRPEEIIALRWSDIDLHAQVAPVQRVRTFRRSEREGSKAHSERDVDLVPQALAAMARHTKMLRAEREDSEDTSHDVFLNPVTRAPWHDERSQRDHYWRPALKRLGTRWRRPYCCRHRFATVALMVGGVPPAYIAAQLGHSVKILLEKYARWIPANDAGHARARLAASMTQDSSQILPTAASR